MKKLKKDSISQLSTDRINYCVAKGKSLVIGDEEYFDGNAAYLIGQNILEDPQASKESKKRAKDVMDFLVENGYVKFELVREGY